jgi:hypothetical protein
MFYYEYVRTLVRAFAADSDSLIDVGSGNAEYIEDFYWIGTRHALDRKKIYSSESVIGINADFLEFTPDRAYDFALCLQVLEHVKRAKPFAEKLFSVADKVMISVPYRWPPDFEASHLHDPVDLAKLRDWTGRDPSYSIVVTEPLTDSPGRSRLIAYYHPPGSEFSLRDLRKNMRPERAERTPKLTDILSGWARRRRDAP